MIRNAQPSDLEKIVLMGERFRKESSYDKYLANNRTCMHDLAARLTTNRTLLVSEKEGQIVGMIGYVVYPHFISGERTAAEIFWWVEPEHRGEGIKLLREMERRAQIAGAKNVQMVAPNEKVSRFYERVGYEFVESIHQKALSNVIQFDNFAIDAERVRCEVIKGDFETVPYLDGGQYSGISQYPVIGWTERISDLLGKEIIPRISCFRLNLEGEIPHSWVHSDGIAAKWATVLYLNEPEQCSGGTAFWKHKELGIDRLPESDDDGLYKRIEEDWKKLELWERTSMVDMKWNRFITYPTSLFHSRFPFEGFGTCPKDGRLIWICFYDLAEEAA